MQDQIGEEGFSYHLAAIDWCLSGENNLLIPRLIRVCQIAVKQTDGDPMRISPKYSVLFLPLALIAALALMTPMMANAQGALSKNDALVRTLTLSATGSIDTKPDVASISTGIETEAVKAGEALDDNNEVMARMMKSLKEAGLESRDIATTQFSVQPRYKHFKNGRAAKVIGYRVTNSLRITVRNLEGLGSILDRLVTFGSNRIGGIEFGLSDPNKALDKARVEAMREALDKATLYAKAANVVLGPITSISERTSRSPMSRVSYGKPRAMASVPIAPGQHRTSVTVNVKWALAE